LRSIPATLTKHLVPEIASLAFPFDRSRRFTAMLFLALLPFTVMAGCASSASLRFSDLNFKRLDPTDPLVVDVAANSCWWWIDGKKVCVAFNIGGTNQNGLGRHERLVFSLVLNGIPAGTEREYRFTRQALRCYRHLGSDHSRYASVKGVATVRLSAGDILSGRFRALAKKQVFHVLTNWTTVGQAFVTGEFTAQRSRERGSSILVQTEEQGMKREPFANTTMDGVPKPQRVVGPDVQ